LKEPESRLRGTRAIVIAEIREIKDVHLTLEGE
jgi:hypothetical protein